MTTISASDVETFKRVNTRVFEVFETLRKNTKYFLGCEYLRCEIHDDYVVMFFTVYREYSTYESSDSIPIEFLFNDDDYIVKSFISSKE